MFAFSNNLKFFNFDPIRAKIVRERRAIYIDRKNRPLPINGVDLSKDNETIQFSVNDINNLIQDINLDDFLFFRFVCYEDLSGLSIIAVIMEKNSRVIKKYLRTDPTAMLAYYQFRKYLLKDSFSDDCDGIAHKVSDY